MSTSRTENNVSPAPPDAKDLIVPEDGVVRAFAFAGGGFDTVMQLGVAHAMLVSKAQAPDVIVGISAGAVNAVTVAEILQAGKDLQGECAREAQITRFRKLLNEYQEWPPALLRSILPDAYEVNFSEGLRPIELPIHHKEERRRRAQAFRARAGLIHLFNGVLRIGVKFGTVTRAARLLLGLSQAAEIRKPRKRGRQKFRLIWRLWRLAGRNLHNVTPQVQLIAWRVLKRWWRQVWKRWWCQERSQPIREGKEAEQIIIVRWWRWLLRPPLLAASYALLAFVWLIVGVGLFAVNAMWAIGLGRVTEWLWNRLRRRGSGNGVSGIWNALLKAYELDKDLGDAHFLEESLVRLFDPDYYGKSKMDDIVDHALEHKEGSKPQEPPPSAKASPKRLSSYARPNGPQTTPGIRVVPVAANVATGELVALPQDMPVVKALMAATAVVPVFRAVRHDHVTYIDGLNISNEATLASMDFLRQWLHPYVRRVHIYPVTPFPLGKESLPKEDISSTSLVDVAMRALQLRRYRDCTLERRMVKLYSDLLPEEKAVHEVGDNKYVRASIHPIEVDEALELNDRIMRAPNDDERRRLILTAVADGCRATLQAMFPKEIQREAEVSKGFPQCRAVMARIGSNGLPRRADEEGPRVGPGVPEVCKSCAVSRATKPEQKQMLRTNHECANWPTWPTPDPNATHATQAEKNPCAAEKNPCAVEKKAITPHQEISNRAYELWRLGGRRFGHDLEDWKQAEWEYETRQKGPWPRNRADENSRVVENRPLVAMLFSGGVFRGVFQVGVLNALKELGLKPDIMAGSSVGSIMAALGAEVFYHDSTQDRATQIAKIAATFLGLDRLILTDRFADFVRRFTLRAAEAMFSPRDVDGVFRRYDARSAHLHNKRLRRVVAGLERLFYASPYELNGLLKASRLRQKHKVHRMVRAYIQEFLDRHGVGLELLGSEPLALLINQLILDVHPDPLGKNREALPFDLFEKRGIRLLATTTNLREGRLDILGQPSQEPVFLVDGLLASCAFPAVFRPRWSWELHRGASPETPLIDGGVMDNLPLDAVVQEMAAPGNRITRRPTSKGEPVPHLLFAASLEANVRTLTDYQANQVASHWPQLWQRAQRLSYNKKIDWFAQLQSDLRKIYEAYDKKGSALQWEPLNIEVVAVKPEWLCGTFAMHPMLGFRRWKQAASIAHGCASTLARFARIKKSWMDAWGVDPKFREQFDESTLYAETDRIKAPQNHGEGMCWFRQVACPFSAGQLKALKSKLSEVKRRELESIYHLCGRPETHRPAG